MTRTIRHHFESPQEADGFAEGVEWVNDSSIQWVETIEGSDETVVVYTDEDHGTEDLDLYYRADS